MKSALLLPLLARGAVAFAPPADRAALPAAALRSSPAAAADEDGDAPPPPPAYPTVNGWTADPDKFCAGLPGAVAPLGDFDPLGFTKDLPIQEIKRFREAEVTHGRVAMLATVGYLVAEPFHPFFNGMVTGPANSHLGQVQEVAPFFFAWLGGSIATAEIIRAKIGFEFPTDALDKNVELKKDDDFEGKTWLTKLNDKYYPGDLKFDPLNLKPTNAEEFVTMQNKELNNGRLAMIASMGMIVQELVTGDTLF